MNVKTLLGGDRAFRRAFLAVALCGAALSFGSAVLRGPAVAGSVLAGALIGLANLYVLARIVAVIAVPHSDARANAAFAWGVIAFGKLMVLCGGMWFLMTHHLVDPIALVVGYGALPFGIAIGGVVSDKTDPEPPREPRAP